MFASPRGLCGLGNLAVSWDLEPTCITVSFALTRCRACNYCGTVTQEA